MTSYGIHLWFKRALKTAGLPETIKMHELRHSAADNLWRETGNIVHAKQLLRHRSVGTTEAYLHPSMDDLTAAMRTMGDARNDVASSREVNLAQAEVSREST
jgi:site-specific recombinase XerD